MAMRWMNIYEFEIQALENYLNEMSAQGYQFEKIGPIYLKFNKKKETCHYFVTINDQKPYDHYQYIDGYKHIKIYKSYQKQRMKHQDEEELVQVKEKMNHSFYTNELFWLMILSVIIFVLAANKEFFVIMEVIANRKIHLIFLYTLLLIATLYRSEEPKRKFKKEVQLIKDSSQIQKRGLTIFLAIFLCIMIVYHLPAFAISLVGYIIMKYLLRKYDKGDIIAIIISGLLCYFGTTTLMELRKGVSQTHNIYPFTYEEVMEQESLWMKTKRYEGEEVTLLEVEVKEGKLQGMFQAMIEGYYHIEDDVHYEKGNYVKKVDETSYLFVKCEENKEWEEVLSK